MSSSLTMATITDDGHRPVTQKKPNNTAKEADNRSKIANTREIVENINAIDFPSPILTAAVGSDLCFLSFPYIGIRDKFRGRLSKSENLN